MAAFLPSLRSGYRFLLPTVALALAGYLSPAQAAHERPWLADTAQGAIVQTIPLPGQAQWRQALTMPDGSVILLRDQDAQEKTAFLARLGPGADTVTSLVPDWSGIGTARKSAEGVARDAFTPVALAHDEKGALWVVDEGADRKSARLLQLDPQTGKVLAVIPLPAEAVTPTSRFTALALHNDTAYLADEGGIALTVVDLRRHAATRFFAGYPSARGHSPLIVDNQVVQGKDGHPLTRDIAYLALENDGAWLYELAPTGPIYRLSTALLTDPSVTPAELMEGVTQWRGTPTVGGLTIDNKATLYLTDVTRGRLLSFDTGRHPHVLLVSPLLVQAGIPGWAPDTRGAGQIYVPAGHSLLRIALP
ncbi:gluconolactonase [Asaia lannensis NBRC 102526]|nr:gluconolactonase [Asaia lannensis NBRC 102526]